MLQGLDTEQDTPTPKVVEALLGTRLRGRQFTRAPLVSHSPDTLPHSCYKHFQQHTSSKAKHGTSWRQLQYEFLLAALTTNTAPKGLVQCMQVTGSRNTLAIEADGQVGYVAVCKRNNCSHGSGLLAPDC